MPRIHPTVDTENEISLTEYVYTHALSARNAAQDEEDEDKPKRRRVRARQVRYDY